MTKPDFIIIGAMKSATSTLHTQLSMQPGVFMSTPKEPNYFSDNEQYAKGVSWYTSLFSQAEETDICGESSTHYTKLPQYPETVERMAECLETPKLIYVMRDPIDRLVSHYIHQWTQNLMRCDINEAIDKYDELISYSCYSMQIQPYLDQFGYENVLPIFMEAIKSDNQQELTRIADFLGYSGQMRWHDEISSQNVSNERVRSFAGSNWLIKSKTMTSLRKTLVPKSVRNLIKRGLTMQERPVIDKQHLEKLTKIFDQDLAVLGKMLNVEINCANYFEITTSKEQNIQFRRG